MERVLLTAEEAADSLKIGRCKVYDLIRTGSLSRSRSAGFVASRSTPYTPSPADCSRRHRERPQPQW